jgi:hypothetical protein
MYMAEFKKFTDVIRLGHKSTIGVLTEGDNIIVQEKIDGANASFRVVDDEIYAFSRNTQLSADNTLRGFYTYAQTLDVSHMNPDYIYFGEWLVAHKIQYHLEAMNQFYLFDVFDTVTQRYLPFDVAIHEAYKLGLNLIHVLYTGQYQGFDHLQSFVGKSDYGDVGEGIVVKNVDYVNKYGDQMYVKLVSDAFAEVQKQKLPKDPNQPATVEQEFVNTYVTTGRVDKMLHKLVDEGVLDEQYGVEDMGVILRNLNVRIYDDLLKEESDSLPDGYDDKLLRKSIGRVLPTMVKDIIASHERVAV